MKTRTKKAYAIGVLTPFYIGSCWIFSALVRYNNIAPLPSIVLFHGMVLGVYLSLVSIAWAIKELFS